MEPQTPIDVQRILDRKRKRTEYDKQLKLKRKIDSESLTAIDEEYVYTSCVLDISMIRCFYHKAETVSFFNSNCIVFVGKLS
jgi:hypothetical protein